MKMTYLLPMFLLLQSSFGMEVDFTAVGVEGMTVQFLDASTYDHSGQNSYLWDFGDGNFSEEQNPIHTYSVEGNYTVCLSVNGLPAICKENTFYITNNGIRVRYDDTIWPNGDITTVSSPFGSRWKLSDSRYDFHRGIDIPGNSGDPIVNIADGIVHTAYTESDPNNTFSSTVVVVQHTMETPIFFRGKFIKTYYSISSHLKSIANGVQKGTLVKKGDFIGTVGRTGDTDYDHNHFEIRVGVLCSRESQLKGNCSSSNPFDEIVDPHVNPLLFLDYASYNINSLRYEILEEDPLRIKITSDRPEIDFNRIEIVKGTERKILDLNLREGISSENIDTNPYQGIAIDVGLYSSNGNQDYVMILTFEDFNSADAVIVTDIWGSSLSISNETKTEIYPYPNPCTESIRFAELSENGEYNYQLFDATGSLISMGKMDNSIPVRHLSNGLYYVKLLNFNNGSPKTFKILKR
ncbi:MAG: peptidoglycan DD-metalloendopeptidase family protein [Allomuricauda sp.]